MEIIGKEDFDSKTKEGIVFVDFFATWCAPCRMMSVVIDDLKNELDEKVKIYKVDVDKNEDVAKSFGIMSIPTMIIFKDGEIKEKHIGLWSKEEIKDCINPLL
ncbi:MAG: thioredoxin [Clostridia bacterium]|nr:thioredoxin [Clostridia bacterium]